MIVVSANRLPIAMSGLDNRPKKYCSNITLFDKIVNLCLYEPFSICLHIYTHMRVGNHTKITLSTRNVFIDITATDLTKVCITNLRICHWCE